MSSVIRRESSCIVAEKEGERACVFCHCVSWQGERLGLVSGHPGPASHSTLVATQDREDSA